MRKIRIAQIGTNRHSHAPEVFISLKTMTDIFDVVGYALVEDERETCQNKMYAFEGYPELSLDEILNDPTIEAVAVETDEIHLLKYAQMAADHGKHIHMEKPGSPSLADFEHLINTVKEKKLTFHVGYMYRYNPFIMEAIQEADEGKFGEIFSVEAQMSRNDKPETREWLGSFPGGMMFYLGCHLVDLVIRLRGEPTAIIPYNRSVDPNGIGTEDYAMAVLEYPNGVSFVKTCAKEIGGFGRRQLVINGTEGSVEIKPLEIAQKGPGFLLRTQRTRRLPDGSPVHEETPTFGRYDTMLQTFAAIVRGEKTNPYTYDYELSVFRAVLACCGVDVDKK